MICVLCRNIYAHILTKLTNLMLVLQSWSFASRIASRATESAVKLSEAAVSKVCFNFHILGIELYIRHLFLFPGTYSILAVCHKPVKVGFTTDKPAKMEYPYLPYYFSCLPTSFVKVHRCFNFDFTTLLNGKNS